MGDLRDDLAAADLDRIVNACLVFLGAYEEHGVGSATSAAVGTLRLAVLAGREAAAVAAPCECDLTEEEFEGHDCLTYAWDHQRAAMLLYRVAAEEARAAKTERDAAVRAVDRARALADEWEAEAAADERYLNGPNVHHSDVRETAAKIGQAREHATDLRRALDGAGDERCPECGKTRAMHTSAGRSGPNQWCEPTEPRRPMVAMCSHGHPGDEDCPTCGPSRQHPERPR